MEIHKKLLVFVLGHETSHLEKIPKEDYLCPVNLNHLSLPIENTNHIAENRFFLLEPEQFKNCPEYIGVLSANYEAKYKDLIRFKDFERLNKLLDRFVVYAASPTESFCNGKWLEYSYSYHKTIKPYIEDMAKTFFLRLDNKPTFWANNFICHKDDFIRFIKFFKDVFKYMHGKYGYDYNITVDDQSRKAAYVYERISMLYFSNREDLLIRRLPGANPFNMNRICWISFAGDNYNLLWKICHESLLKAGIREENIKHEHMEINDAVNGQVMFQSPVWYHSNHKKIIRMIEVLSSFLLSDQYDYFIYHDCDTQIFGNRDKVWEDLFSYIDTTDSDFYFQPEIVGDQYELCAGIFIIKKNKLQRAINFLQMVLKKMNNTPLDLMPFADQSVIKELKDKIYWSYIPPKYCTFAGILEEKNRKTYLFHHAINARNLETKLAQLRKTQKFMEESKSTFKINL